LRAGEDRLAVLTQAEPNPSFGHARERLHFLHLVGEAVDILNENLNDGPCAVVTTFLAFLDGAATAQHRREHRHPSWVKAYGGRRSPILADELEVTTCDLQFSISTFESRDAKSSGKRSILRLTAWLSTLVGTSYNSARSESIMTFCPRMTWIRFSTGRGAATCLIRRVGDIGIS